MGSNIFESIRIKTNTIERSKCNTHEETYKFISPSDDFRVSKKKKKTRETNIYEQISP